MALSYSVIIRKLESLGVMPDKAPSLDTTQTALKKIGFFEHFQFWPKYQADPSRSIIVAGTNGKGSVCATLEALFLSLGERTGLYTSPHLVETTERIRLCGKEVEPDLFCLAYETIVSRVGDLKLTHFEMLTLMASWVFCSGEAVPIVDRFICEVGLGGLWDATNAIPHGVCIITRLGLDHENLLGNSLEEIARNKLGVIPINSKELPSGPLVIHVPFPKEAGALAEKTKLLAGGTWTECVPFQSHYSKGPVWNLTTPWGESPICLPGKRGAENTALALTAFSALGFDPAKNLTALSQVKWPGRMERLTSLIIPCPVYVSGDHNPQGVESLIELLPAYPRSHLHIVVAVGRDKDLKGVLDPLFKLQNASVYLTRTPFRGRPLEDYHSYLDRAVGAWESLQETLEQLKSRVTREDLVLITGSLYLVGEAKRIFSCQFNS